MQEREVVVDRFADVLSERLGRSAEDLRERGLATADFRSCHCEVEWEDGSHAKFEHAIAVHDPTRHRVGIFTEHCGYLDLDQLGIERVSETETHTRWVLG